MSQDRIASVRNGLAVIGHKGGTAKTTSTTNLAASVAAAGGRALIVDLCSQGNATHFTAAVPGQGPRVSDILDADPGDTAQLQHIARTALVRSPWSDLPPLAAAGGRIDVIPASMALDWVDPQHRVNLRLALADLAADYTVVLFDLPPTVGPVAQAALVAARGALMLAEPEPGSTDGLPNTRSVIDQVWTSYSAYGLTTATPVGVLMTKYDGRKRTHREFAAIVRAWSGSLFLEPPIPSRAVVADTQVYLPHRGIDNRMPLLAAGAAGEGLARLYAAVAATVLPRLGPGTEQVVDRLLGHTPEPDDLLADTPDPDELQAAADPDPGSDREVQALAQGKKSKKKTKSKRAS